MLRNDRGISNIGCLLMIALLVGVFYAGYKFALVQWNLENFKEQMTEVTRYWATQKPDGTQVIKEEVIRRAKKCGFTLIPEDIQIDTEGVFVSITASWLEPIAFPGGYVYQRPIEVARKIKKTGY